MVAQALATIPFTRTWFVGAVALRAVGFHVLAGIHLLLLYDYELIRNKRLFPISGPLERRLVNHFKSRKYFRGFAVLRVIRILFPEDECLIP